MHAYTLYPCAAESYEFHRFRPISTIFPARFHLFSPPIGIAVSNKYNGESKAALGSEGVFDAVSAGILIYNGLCDLIVPTFSDDDLPQSWTMQVAGFGALYTGAATMALIGKWA